MTQDLQDDLVQKTHFQHDLQNSSKFLQSKEGKGRKPKVFELDTSTNPVRVFMINIIP
jgi:hypothetical protein